VAAVFCKLLPNLVLNSLRHAQPVKPRVAPTGVDGPGRLKDRSLGLQRPNVSLLPA